VKLFAVQFKGKESMPKLAYYANYIRPVLEILTVSSRGMSAASIQECLECSHPYLDSAKVLHEL